jgi:ubiquinone/menaquinone biosynthesis C-methylase UbiE
MTPDWKLPQGVDRGLWDYVHSQEMVAGYDDAMNASALAATDVRYCEAMFTQPGTLIDLGCGTGRLAVHMAGRGFACVGVDLSEEMLIQATRNADRGGVRVQWLAGNLVELKEVPSGRFDYATCLFSTLGMIRGADNRLQAMRETARVLKPGGRFVWHVHNRYFRGLGWGEVLKQTWLTLTGNSLAGEVTAKQAYAGAALTLHHFTKTGARNMLEEAGFRILDWQAVTVTGELRAPRFGWDSSAYGYLICAEKTVG